MTYDKKKQMKAIRDCLHNRGWKYVSVAHLHTNQFSESIKTYCVMFRMSTFENPLSYIITVMNFGIADVRSENIVFLDIINALDKALKESK